MTELAQRLVAILFVADGPVSPDRLAMLTTQDGDAITAALNELGTALEATGLALSHHHDGYRLTTASVHADTVKAYLQDEAGTELSKPALETLSIVAYRGPVSRSQIEAIRGVGSEAMVKSLVARGLIAASAKSSEPGRPPLFTVTPLFLDLFGLKHVGQLPALDEVDAA